MQDFVYLDNSSTTKPCDTAIEYINKALSEHWGNPSSLHRLGVEAENAVTEARESIAELLHCRNDEIFFTGSGTEANNTALFGAAYRGKKRGKRIVTTEIEHSSVLEAIDRLSQEGFEVIKLKPQKDGKISEDDIKNAITPNTVLVSIMLVNNETGAIQPVKAAADAIKAVSAPALLHCDAVQAFGKMPFSPAKLGVDLLTASGHKLHGPKGIGFLYIKKGVHIRPYIIGGGQESGMRSGTESVPLICGLLGALKALPDLKHQLACQSELWLYAKKTLLNTGLVTVNSPENALPYILNISVNGYRSETILHFLEADNIFVSSGSACAKGGASYVLRAMGLEPKSADSAIRLSFSRYNTRDDIDRLAISLEKASKKLRKA